MGFIPGHISKEEAAKRLGGISVQTVGKLIRDGNFDVFQRHRNTEQFISEESFHRYIKNKTQKATAFGKPAKQ